MLRLTRSGRVPPAAISQYGRNSHFGGGARLDMLLEVELLRATAGAFAALHPTGYITAGGDFNFGGNITTVRKALHSINKKSCCRTKDKASMRGPYMEGPSGKGPLQDLVTTGFCVRFLCGRSGAWMNDGICDLCTVYIYILFLYYKHFFDIYIYICQYIAENNIYIYISICVIF